MRCHQSPDVGAALSAAERLEDLEVERRLMEFLFGDTETCTLMDPHTFEQIAVPRPS